MKNSSRSYTAKINMKFKVGDSVYVKSTGIKGVVTFVDYSDNTLPYKILFNGIKALIWYPESCIDSCDNSKFIPIDTSTTISKKPIKGFWLSIHNLVALIVSAIIVFIVIESIALIDSYKPLSNQRIFLCFLSSMIIIYPAVYCWINFFTKKSK